MIYIPNYRVYFSPTDEQEQTQWLSKICDYTASIIESRLNNLRTSLIDPWRFKTNFWLGRLHVFEYWCIYGSSKQYNELTKETLAAFLGDHRSWIVNRISELEDQLKKLKQNKYLIEDLVPPRYYAIRGKKIFFLSEEATIELNLSCKTRVTSSELRYIEKPLLFRNFNEVASFTSRLKLEIMEEDKLRDLLSAHDVLLSIDFLPN